MHVYIQGRGKSHMDTLGEQELAQRKEEVVQDLVGKLSRKMGTQVSPSIVRSHVQWLIDRNGTSVLSDEDSLYVGVESRLNNVGVSG